MRSTQTEKGYIIRIDRDENVVATLLNFAKEQNIHSGIFHGIGAVKKAEYGYYDLPLKKYVFKEAEAPMEVVSMTGNIAMVGGEQFIHMHAVFSDMENKTSGGHVKEMTVGVVLEVFLENYGTELNRVYDDDIGLKLLDL